MRRWMHNGRWMPMFEHTELRLHIVYWIVIAGLMLALVWEVTE